MTRDELIGQLLGFPDEIGEWEAELLRRQSALQDAREALDAREAAILLGTVPGAAINGKNAEQRAAEMRGFTDDERLAVRLAEAEVGACRIALDRRRNGFAACRAVARLLSGDVLDRLLSGDVLDRAS